MSKKTLHITVKDYIKGIKIGSREAELENSNGFVSTHKVHQSRKAYNRKENKKIIEE